MHSTSHAYIYDAGFRDSPLHSRDHNFQYLSKLLRKGKEKEKETPVFLIRNATWKWRRTLLWLFDRCWVLILIYTIYFTLLLDDKSCQKSISEKSKHNTSQHPYFALTSQIFALSASKSFGSGYSPVVRYRCTEAVSTNNAFQNPCHPS